MKLRGAFESVVKGVSQQAPMDRLEGQYGEAVNMIFDPVRGATRRNGLVFENQKFWATRQTSPGDHTQEDRDNAMSDTFSYRVLPFRTFGEDFDLLYRSRHTFGTYSTVHLPGMLLYSRTMERERFIPTTTAPDDMAIVEHLKGGFSAVTVIGGFVIAAPAGVPATHTLTENWGNPINQRKASVWIRGGGYSRTYKLKATRIEDGRVFSVEYTTPPSQYPGVLDFTGITEDPSTPEYQAEVNKIQAAYDTAVNQHTAMAGAAIVPSAIAARLREKLSEAGWRRPWPEELDDDPSWPCSYWERWESTLLCSDVAAMEVDDGGNGDFMRETLNTETTVDQLPTIAHFGKIVKIQPLNSDPFYMRSSAITTAQADWPANWDEVGWGRVQWRETAGTTQELGDFLVFGQYYQENFFLASSPKRLRDLIAASGLHNAPALAAAIPQWVPSKAGDIDTNLPPPFMGQPITLLDTFQDRLILGAGSVIHMSERSNYLNMYRTTVVTLPESDPVTVSASNIWDDTVRYATHHEMNLFIHGDKRHYMIPGRTAVLPGQTAMAVMWDVQNASNARPVSNGANLFILKEEMQVGASRLLQVQPGLYQDIPQLQDISQQLRDYINGYPAELVAFLNPGTVFVRTEFVPKSRYGAPRSRPNGLYMYQYTDQGEQRLVDAWSAWEWDPAIGRPIGIAPAGFGDTLRIYTYTFGTNATGDPGYAVLVNRVSIRPDPTGLPYLDAVQVGGKAELIGMFSPAVSPEVASRIFTSPGAAFSYEGPVTGHNPDVVEPDGPNWTVADTDPNKVDPYRWYGVNGWLSKFDTQFGPFTPERKAAIFTGLKYHSYVELTNPHVRDQNGKVQTMGTLKLTRFHVTVIRTAGMRATWKDYDGQEKVTEFTQAYKQIDYQQSVFIGRDAKHVQVRLAAMDWLPLTINAISWQGDYFQYKPKG